LGPSSNLTARAGEGKRVGKKRVLGSRNRELESGNRGEKPTERT